MADIRMCGKPDVEALMRFIDEHWSRGHVLSWHQALMDWQHFDPASDRYNFVLGCAAQLCGADPAQCKTFGCPVNQDWYLWDQRYYKSWLCKHCLTAMGKVDLHEVSGRRKTK